MNIDGETKQKKQIDIELSAKFAKLLSTSNHQDFAGLIRSLIFTDELTFGDKMELVRAHFPELEGNRND